MELKSRGWMLYIFTILSAIQLAIATNDVLAGRPAHCNGEGGAVDVKLDHIDKCYSCICKNGFIECRNEFPTDGCHMLVERSSNSYCLKCKGCMYKGRYHESHTEWTEKDRPCKALRCEAGIVTESELQCHTPCSNPQKPAPGQCCATCPECKINGQIAMADRDVTSDDPCLKCRCVNRKMVCAKKACPVLQCTLKNQWQPEGECCPRCNNTRKLFYVPKRCYLGSGIFAEGEKFDVDKCTTCACSNETMICQRRSCPVLNCAPYHQKNISGSCCKICVMPEDFRQNNQCNYMGNVYEDGQSWKLDACSSCKCHRGMPSCAMTRCNITIPCPPGTRFVHNEGECCGKCEENEGVCMVFGDPHYKTFDGKIYRFPGLGKYQLVSDCRTHTFSIRVTNMFQNKNRHSTLTKRVSIKYGGVRIILGQKYRVKLDGQKISVPYKREGKIKIEKEHEFLALKFNNGIKVLWNGKSFLEITVPTSYKSKLCGLCGNFNGDVNDDFKLRNGTVVNSSKILKFGASWCVGMNCEKQARRTAAIKPCPQKAVLNSKRSLCKYLTSTELFNGCDSKLNYSQYFKACMNDMCRCPNDKCYCESLMAYAQECKRLGVDVKDWQKNSYCSGNYRRPKPAPLTTPRDFNLKKSHFSFSKPRGGPPMLMD